MQKRGIERAQGKGETSVLYRQGQGRTHGKKENITARHEAVGGKRVSLVGIREKTITGQGKGKNPGRGGACPEEQRGGQ